MTRLLQNAVLLCGTLVLSACVTTRTDEIGAVKSTSATKEVSQDKGPARPASELNATTPARTKSKIHTELGMEYLRNGRPGVALDEAKEAIRFDPTYGTAHLLMGMIYESLEQFSQARSAYEEAVRQGPGDPEINDRFGLFQCRHGQPADGLARLEQAARNPYYNKSSQAWNSAGICLMSYLKDNDGAEKRFLAAIAADGRSVEPKMNLALLAYRTGRYARAKQYVDEAQQMIPRPGPDVLWLAARIEKKLGNAGTVDIYGQRLRKDFPGSNEAYYFSQGKFE